MSVRIQETVAPYVSRASNFLRRMVMPSQETSSTVCITRREQSHFSTGNVRIDHDSLSSVLLREGVRDKPIAVISIVGLMRTDKSFLLNFILRYLENSGNVLLVDTQGLFDHKTPERVNKVVLTLSTLMSSVQIFNSKQQIDSSQLRYLKICVDYAQETARSQAKSHYLKLQNLVFLIRDHVAHDEDDNDGAAYLDSVLNETEGDEELVHVRKRIKESFENVSCFYIEHPGFDAEKSTFQGLNKELRPEFLVSVKQFVEYLMDTSNLQPKCSNERPLTGKELLNMITSFDTIFAENKFDPEQIMEANAKAFYAAESEKIYSEFTAKIEDLDKIYYRLENEVHQKFRSGPLIGNGQQKDAFANNLAEQCRRYRDNVEERVRLKEVKKKLKMQKGLRKAFHRYVTEVQNFAATTNKSGDDLREFSSRTSHDILQEVGDELDRKEFDEQTTSWFNDFFLKYNERRKEKEGAEQRQTENTAFRTVKELQSNARDTWKEHVQVVRDEEDLKKKAAQIHNELLNCKTGLYWKKVLSNKETKNKQILFDRLEETEFGGYLQPPRFVLSKDASRPGIEKIVKEFDRERTTKMNAGVHMTKEILNEMWQGSLMAFYRFCSEHYITYSSKLAQLLHDASIEAQKINELNLYEWEENFTAEVDILLIEGKQKLEEEMKDKYLGAEVLESYYKKAKADLKKAFQESNGRTSCKQQQRHFQQQQAKLEKVYDAIKSSNEKNKSLKPVHTKKPWCPIS